MHSKWKDAEKQMKRLCTLYEGYRRTPIVSVHTTLIYRSLDLLYNHEPQTKLTFEPVRDILALYSTAPDEVTDYEFGKGKHYYSAVSSRGLPRFTSGGYYKNGANKFAPSARTMLETDYTMALTLQYAGFNEAAAQYLSRAVHMLADICCLPHAACWTYFSPKKGVHIGYEDLARIMYPDSVRTQTITPSDLRLFTNESLRKVLNSIVKAEADEVQEFLHSPEKEIKKRLLATEKNVAAFFFRFYKDISLPPERSHCIKSGMYCRPFADMPPMRTEVRSDGVHLINSATESELPGRPVFSVTHIRGNKFLLAAVHEKHGKVVEYGKKLSRRFSPNRRDQQLIFSETML